MLPLVDLMRVDDPNDGPVLQERDWGLFPRAVFPFIPAQARVEPPLRIVETAHGPLTRAKPTLQVTSRAVVPHSQQGATIAVENEDDIRSTLHRAAARRALPIRIPRLARRESSDSRVSSSLVTSMAIALKNKARGDATVASYGIQ